MNITGTDNWACNGVVHVIDAVLLPPSLTAPTTTTTTTTPVTDLPATGNEPTMALLAGLFHSRRWWPAGRPASPNQLINQRAAR